MAPGRHENKMVMGARRHTCQTEGCPNIAQCWIEHPVKNRKKNVCKDCRDELVAVYKWKKVDW